MDNRSIFFLSGHLVGRCVFIGDAGLLLTNSSGLSLKRGLATPQPKWAAVHENGDAGAKRPTKL
jgi:hypothetical protein